MIICARHLAAALSYLGADVESALLELASVAPVLDAKVRKELFRDSTAKLQWISDRNSSGMHFIAQYQPRWICAMHAVDQVTRILDDSDVVQYLKAKFPDTNIEVLIV